MIYNCQPQEVPDILDGQWRGPSSDTQLVDGQFTKRLLDWLVGRTFWLVKTDVLRTAATKHVLSKILFHRLAFELLYTITQSRTPVYRPFPPNMGFTSFKKSPYRTCRESVFSDCSRQASPRRPITNNTYALKIISVNFCNKQQGC